MSVTLEFMEDVREAVETEASYATGATVVGVVGDELFYCGDLTKVLSFEGIAVWKSDTNNLLIFSGLANYHDSIWQVISM